MGLFSFSSLSPINFLLTKKEKIITPEVKTFQDVPFGNLTKVKGGSNIAYTEGQKDYSTQNYYSNPTGDAQVIIRTKKEANVSPDISQATEKGFGSTGATATGEGATATETKGLSSSILIYALIGAGLLAGVYILKKK